MKIILMTMGIRLVQGAGLIQLTGKSQKIFIEYLLKVEMSDDKIQELTLLLNGFKMENGIYVNTEVINGMTCSEYLAENYAVESTVWFFGEK